MSPIYQDYAAKLLACLHRPRVRRSQPSLLHFNDALCMPLSSLDPYKLKLQGGLYFRNGGYIPSSGLITNKQVIVGDGHLPRPNSAPTLSGNSLYLGVCHYHFGHFLIETFSRLWFLKPSEIKRFDHIILLPLGDAVPQFAIDLFKMLGVDKSLRVIKEPMFLEKVCLPGPAIEYPQQVYQAISNIHRLFAQPLETEQTEQAVFLSRSQLVPGHNRVIIGEDVLEQALQAQGIAIFHPQNHPINEQITALYRHRTIIGFAGSALHTLILSGGAKKVITYSDRKIPPIFSLLDNALNNQGSYLQASRTPLQGLASLSVGFKPQLIDPRVILRNLKQQGIITDDAIQNYGTTASDAREVRRYNTALLLRWALEASQIQPEDDCHAYIKTFTDRYGLDADMLMQAKQGSELMRRFF